MACARRASRRARMRACTVCGPCWLGAAAGACGCSCAGVLLLESVLCARAPNDKSEITARTPAERRKENIGLDLPPTYTEPRAPLSIFKHLEPGCAGLSPFGRAAADFAAITACMQYDESDGGHSLFMGRFLLGFIFGIVLVPLG